MHHEQLTMTLSVTSNTPARKTATGKTKPKKRGKVKPVTERPSDARKPLPKAKKPRKG